MRVAESYGVLQHFVDFVRSIEPSFLNTLLFRLQGVKDIGTTIKNLRQSSTLDDIELLLRERCIDTRLYLQHGLTLSQLAQELGTNRTYLSLFFSRQNTNYNLYINDLRILYFVRIYSEAVAAGRDFTAQELAAQSGYRSYSTFSHAFKQRMGKSVKEWMSEEGQ